MEIKFFGHACFRLRGKSAVILTDPYDPYIGFKLPKIAADLVTISHEHKDHNYREAVTGSSNRKKPFVISGPGEYEIAGVSVFGIMTFHDASRGKERGENTVYMITLDDVRLAHLGDLGHKLTDAQLEEINGVDVLMIPVGGTYTLDAKEAVEVISQVEPKIVIPMHYHLPGLTIKLAPVETFLKEIGAEKVKPISKLTITKDRLPEEREVVVLEKQ
jgi:L-ascorbate metabolism protein UlaG (beta-lactamase superfamily)